MLFLLTIFVKGHTKTWWDAGINFSRWKTLPTHATSTATNISTCHMHSDELRLLSLPQVDACDLNRCKCKSIDWIVVVLPSFFSTIEACVDVCVRACGQTAIIVIFKSMFFFHFFLPFFIQLVMFIQCKILCTWECQTHWQIVIQLSLVRSILGNVTIRVHYHNVQSGAFQPFKESDGKNLLALS